MYQCEFIGYEEDGLQETDAKDIQVIDARPNRAKKEKGGGGGGGAGHALGGEGGGQHEVRLQGAVGGTRVTQAELEKKIKELKEASKVGTATKEEVEQAVQALKEFRDKQRADKDKKEKEKDPQIAAKTRVERGKKGGAEGGGGHALGGERQ